MRIRPACHFLIAATALLTNLSAQVSPLAQSRIEGNNAAFYPIGLRNANAAGRMLHYQQVHDDVTRKSIASMSFRRDSKAAYFYSIPSYWAELEIALSTAKTTASTISNTFAKNEGNDRKVVFKKKRINFPTTTKLLTLVPQPVFPYIIKFDSAFVWTNPKSLCWDMKMFDNNIHTVIGDPVYLDATNITTTSVPGFSLTFGRGCFSSNQAITNAAITTASFRIDQKAKSINLSINGCYFTPGSQGFAMLGLSRTAFKGQGLPLGLGSLGAPGCTLLQSWDLQLPVKMDFKGNLGPCGGSSGGSVVKPIGGGQDTGLVTKVPHSTPLEGFSLYAQIYAVDAKANALGIVVGNASQAVIPLSYANGMPANRLLRPGTTAMTSAVGSRSTVSPWATIVNFN